MQPSLDQHYERVEQNHEIVFEWGANMQTENFRVISPQLSYSQEKTFAFDDSKSSIYTPRISVKEWTKFDIHHCLFIPQFWYSTIWPKSILPITSQCLFLTQSLLALPLPIRFCMSSTKMSKEKWGKRDLQMTVKLGSPKIPSLPKMEISTVLQWHATM